MRRPGQSAWVIDPLDQAGAMVINGSSDPMFASWGNIPARTSVHIQITVFHWNSP